MILLKREKIKRIEGYPDYFITNFGRVYSTKRKGLFLKPQKKLVGYLYVDLMKNGKANKYHIHRLVAEHFILNDDNKLLVNHKDLNKQNNRFDNLEWVTCSENIKHAYDNGAYELNHLKKKVASIDLNSGNIIKVYRSIYDTRADGYQYSNVCSVLKGRRKTHKGVTFVYI